MVSLRYEIGMGLSVLWAASASDKVRMQEEKSKKLSKHQERNDVGCQIFVTYKKPRLGRCKAKECKICSICKEKHSSF